MSLAITGTPAFAQDTDDAEQPTDVQVVTYTPPRLVRQATPFYPEGASGEAEVTVVVTIGRDGSVLAVTPSSGPEAFAPAAVEAGHRLLFEPATRGGEAVEAQLPVVFRFAPPAGPPLPEVDEFVEIVVEATRSEVKDTHARVTIDGAALERARGQDLAETVSQVPGVTAARGTADSSKPIIRGQYERRLLVLYDGVRHESQKWGSDHATEIDPFAAGEISVIKGAAGVRYGPDAIGGVLLVNPPALRSDPGFDGSAQFVGVSNGRRGVGALRLDGALAAVPGLALRIDGSFARGAALSTPDYVLGNTGSEQWNLGAMARYQRDFGVFTLAYHHYDLRAGVCYCVNSSSVEDFLGQLDAEAPVGAESWDVSYAIDRPYQSVMHDLALARGAFFLGGGGVLRATYAFQNNDRKEYEQVRESVTGPQYDFTLRTHSLDLDLTHGSVALGDSRRLDGGIGVAGSFQENVYRGLPLIPNHRAGTAGIYGFERLSAGRVAIEVGARYDHQSRSTFLTESAFERHLARETLDEEDCERTESAARCGLSFDTGSFSAGALWHAVPDHLDLKLDLSSANRFPNGDELYMNGSAPTSPVYALGDPGLGVETTWGASPTVGLRLSWLEAEASTYANLVDNYIYFAPEIGEDGEPEFDVTIRGAYPRFTFRAVDALFYGVDGGLTLGPEWPLGIVAQGSIVRGIDRATGDPLLYVPPDRLRFGLVGKPPPLGPVTDPFVEISGEYVAEQTRVVEGADLAPPPDPYFLLGASIGAEVQLRHERVLRIGIEGSNLLNGRYRDYTSLLRYFADEPGRDVRLRLGFDF